MSRRTAALVEHRPQAGSRARRRSERSGILHARIAIVATIVVGQLWGLTCALNRYFDHESIVFLLGFQAISFLAALRGARRARGALRVTAEEALPDRRTDVGCRPRPGNAVSSESR